MSFFHAGTARDCKISRSNMLWDKINRLHEDMHLYIFELYLAGLPRRSPILVHLSFEPRQKLTNSSSSDRDSPPPSVRSAHRHNAPPPTNNSAYFFYRRCCVPPRTLTRTCLPCPRSTKCGSRCAAQTAHARTVDWGRSGSAHSMGHARHRHQRGSGRVCLRPVHRPTTVAALAAVWPSGGR